MSIAGYSLPDLFALNSKTDINLKWFLKNHGNLIRDYNNEFIAIENEDVIEHHSEMEGFFNRLKRNENYSNSTLIKFITK
jgi:hypothetical protein